ncbi:MAG: VOC family protein [Bdellovibrionaceae bacterium]|nr:VOC family protein [Pseudobdellovibrionaceae bacterium]
MSESVSSAGKPHHIELYCSDLKKSREFWSWFLSTLGYKQFQEWHEGISFKLADTYIVFVQEEAKHLDSIYNRCRPGLNHLAFHATSRQQVDELTSQLRERQVRILYEDRHPHAGGSGSYAVFFEDPERIKVELVAP